ncbi:hypothetical protein [Candidatus Pelagibacter sp.]|uniref:hypothetical protein n=1 Tax=Candidatus Pelagibacter sp. TaxID=2024849 RepID=UPI003F83BE90
MAEEQDLETFVSISPKEFGVYLFDIKNRKNLYSKELKLNNDTHSIDFKSLDLFLAENIFKLEKFRGEFIKNITLIIEHIKISNINFAIKRKNYEKIINRKYFENTLIDAKDLFKENFQSEKIMHIIINKYLVNGKNYPTYQESLHGDSFCVELKFISIPINLTAQIESMFQKYHININEYLDGKYIKTLSQNNFTIISDLAYKVKSGYIENEVKLIPKNYKKNGIFEKFFQLFS